MKKLLFTLFTLLPAVLYCQDPQFTQYYNAPLIINPAMAGETECYRAGFNARSQWTGLPGGAFNTASVFMDLNYPDMRSGFGLLAVHDEIGTPRLSANELSGFYSYLLPVSEMVNFRLGLQGTYVNRYLDYSHLVFEDQFSGITVTNPTTIDQVHNYAKVEYADASTGVLLFGEDKYWVGFSAHHLTRPHQGFYQDSRLPVNYSLHGGFNFYPQGRSRRKNDDAMRIIPTFMYKGQAKFDQLDLGVYFIQAPYLFGLWYRGIPVKKDNQIYNRDAINVQTGFQYKNFSFTYSYDFTISRLNIKNTHGSHEISLIYLFCADWPKRRKPGRHARRLPCPDFQRSMKYKKNYLGF